MENIEHRAAGFIAESASAQIENAAVENVKKISTADMENGYAGGFIGVSHTGGLAEIGDLKTDGVLSITNLLSAIQYLTPKYTNCVVSYIEDIENQQVEAACAGGFAGKLESGTVDNSEAKNTAVKNISNVYGRYYAGGFVGSVRTI